MLQNLLKDFKAAVGKLFSENGDISATRVHLLLSLILGFILAVVGLFQKVNLADLAILVGVFTGPSAVLKGFQKTVEK